MKIKNVNNEGIKNIKKAILVGTSVVLMGSMTACSTNASDGLATETQSVVQNDDRATTGNVIDSNDVVILETQATQTAPQTTYTYTQEAFDAFVSENWELISGKINNIDKDAFYMAEVIFNIKYLNENNPQIIVDACAKGIDIERELNKAYNVYSQIREYNTSLKDGEPFYSFANLLLSAKDRAIIPVLEKYAITMQSLDPTNAADVEKANQLFNQILGFSKGETKLAVVVGDQIIEVAQIELSLGGVMASENVMQDFSVASQRMVSEEKRAELDKSLMMKDVLARVEQILIEKNAIAGVTVSQASEEEVQLILEQVQYMEDVLGKEVAFMGITQEESDALFVIRNIDFFMDSTNSHNVFTRMYENGFDIDKTMELAESAVAKMVDYNYSTEDATELYDAGHFGIDNPTDIISIKAIVQEFDKFKSDDPEVVADSIMDMKAYTQYSSEGFVTYQERSNGELSDPIRLDKNALSKGGNQFVDWYTYYSLLKNKDLFIGNEGLYDSLISYVSERNNGLTPYVDIVLMVDGFCAENNIAVYDYEIGNQK